MSKGMPAFLATAVSELDVSRQSLSWPTLGTFSEESPIMKHRPEGTVAPRTLSTLEESLNLWPQQPTPINAVLVGAWTFEAMIQSVSVTFAQIVGLVESRTLTVHGLGLVDLISLPERLRSWTQMPVTELTDLLGVSRGSFYHWKKGQISVENQLMLTQVAEAIGPIAKLWSPIRVRQWLQAPAVTGLLKEGNLAEFARVAREVVSAPEIPLIEASVITMSEHRAVDSVESLTPGDVRTALDTFRRPRAANAGRPWSPPEIADSRLDDE